MIQSVVKVPFGPEFALHSNEFIAVTRHRIMIFIYFGLVCMILVTTMGRRDPIAAPELILGMAAIEVMIGIMMVLLCKVIVAWRARQTGTIPRVRLAWVLVLTVTAAVSSAEVLEPLLFGQPNSTPLQFALKLVFYLTLVEILTSIMLQYTLGYILDDLRKKKLGAADEPLDTTAEKPLA